MLNIFSYTHLIERSREFAILISFTTDFKDRFSSIPTTVEKAQPQRTQIYIRPKIVN